MEVRLISLTQPVASAENPESLVAYCARVSSPNQGNPEHSKLLRYCLKHGHWSPFEMADMTLEITTSRAISAQILRHRSFSFQEFCVAGDTLITLELPGGVERGKRSAYKRSIEHLYRLQEAGKKLPACVRVFDELTQSFVTTGIKEVFQTGVKPLFRLTLDNGRYVDCTKEHKLFTRHGFVSLEDAVGLSVIGSKAVMSKKDVAFACNGQLAYQDKEWLGLAKQRSIQNKTGLSGIAEEAGVTVHCIRKWLKIHGLQFSKKEVALYTPTWNKGVVGYKTKPHTPETIEKMKSKARKGADSNLWRGGADRSERIKIADWCNSHRIEFLRAADYKCKRCDSNQKLELHHIEPVFARPDLAYEKSNIEVLCKKCHSEHHKNAGHAKSWRQKSKGHTLTLTWSHAVKIEYLGEFMTYDMEVEHGSHNYIANGIITHNSQRYAEALDYEPCGARRQDETNRQNSLDDLDENVREWFLESQVEMWHWAKRRYDKALALGVAKECARMLLPLNTQTRLYMKGSLRSWIHYIQVRTAPETQLEHREIAEKAKAIFCEKLPIIASALEWN